jgi:hypothetical protein
MTRLASRRNVLKGALGGAAVTVGLPFLDCFLNTNGTALAATGKELPVCFGTWYQGLGFDPGQWIPEKVGTGYTNKHQLRMFEPLKHKINIISGTKYFMDGRPLETHTSGYQISSTGSLRGGVVYGASLDQIIADQIGKRTRFRSLEASIGGGRRSFSKGVGANTNPAETSPTQLYTRIFGPEFIDPNAADFQPDPMVMARQSVLSAVKDERMAMMSQVGAADKARLEQYFTSLRDIENQLAIEMQKPDPLPSCVMPTEAKAGGTGDSVVEAEKNGTIFGNLLANALACGQTRVINIVMGSNGLRKPGNALSWHVLTHEEPVDDTLGYQREVGWFVEWANTRFFDFIKAMDDMKEGDGTVLDRIALLWQTDHGYARTHTMDDLATLVVGGGAGRLKTGMHIRAAGDPQTRVGLTMQQVMGVSVNSWGGGSNQTSKPMTELLA